MAVRGATVNPTSRFSALEIEPDPEFFQGAFTEDAGVQPATRFWDDHSQTIITKNTSPDIPFTHSLNVYRGCEHGCAYCYARPTHEYLGFSAGVDFERHIVVKREAPELLRRALTRPSWKPQVLAMSGVTDCYQPAERHLRLTRACLEVLLEFRNPVEMITKNALVLRDLDLLQGLAQYGCVQVHISISSLDPELVRRMEPRASQPARKLKAIARLVEAGIPVMALLAPIIPGLNDHEIPAILQAVGEAGVQAAGCIPLRLPGAVSDVFQAWLHEHFPDRAGKVLNKIRSLRGGQLNDSRFHSRFQGEGEQAAIIEHLFKVGVKKAGIPQVWKPFNMEAFRRPAPSGPEQLELF